MSATAFTDLPGAKLYPTNWTREARMKTSSKGARCIITNWVKRCSSGPLDRYRNPVRSGLRSRIGLALISVGIGSTIVFSGGAQFSNKKFGAMRSISSKNRWNRSHPRDFWAVQSLKISHAIFWQFRPIVPGFRWIWLQFDQIPGRSAEFTKKWHMYFWFCHMMLWRYDKTMI